MLKIFISISLVFFYSLSLSAQDKNFKKEVTVQVLGMVCPFCAQGIEKNLNALKEVKETKVNLDKMEVKISLSKNQKLSEKKIKKIIEGAGFKFKGIKDVQ